MISILCLGWFHFIFIILCESLPSVFQFLRIKKKNINIMSCVRLRESCGRWGRGREKESCPYFTGKRVEFDFDRFRCISWADYDEIGILKSSFSIVASFVDFVFVCPHSFWRPGARQFYHTLHFRQHTHYSMCGTVPCVLKCLSVYLLSDFNDYSFHW